MGFDREMVQERLAKLSNGVAVIRVGGSTERDMHDRVTSTQAAIRAARAALVEGILPGGCTALVAAAAAVDVQAHADADERAGAEMVVHALEAPLKTLADRAGCSESAVLEILGAVRTTSRPRAFDALTGRLVSLEDRNAPVDPVARLRRAVLGAASLAERILTTQGVLVTPAGEPGGDAVVP